MKVPLNTRQTHVCFETWRSPDTVTCCSWRPAASFSLCTNKKNTFFLRMNHYSSRLKSPLSVYHTQISVDVHVDTINAFVHPFLATYSGRQSKYTSTVNWRKFTFIKTSNWYEFSYSIDRAVSQQMHSLCCFLWVSEADHQEPSQCLSRPRQNEQRSASLHYTTLRHQRRGEAERGRVKTKKERDLMGRKNGKEKEGRRANCLFSLKDTLKSLNRAFR